MGLTKEQIRCAVVLQSVRPLNSTDKCCKRLWTNAVRQFTAVYLNKSSRFNPDLFASACGGLYYV